MSENEKNLSDLFPVYDIVYDVSWNRTIYKLYVPTFHQEELKIFQEENDLLVEGKPRFIDNGHWENIFRKPFKITIPLNADFVFESAVLEFGVLYISYKRKIKPSPDYFKINVPAPKASDHPQLLNEDSDF